MSQLVVLDFDGTMTDAEAEGEPFVEGYLEDVATLSGLPTDEVFDLAARFAAELAGDPTSHGWWFEGRIVAPASVDPYLRVIPIAHRIFDVAGVFPQLPERGRLLDQVLYKYNYGKTKIVFRPGAREVLLALRGADAYIVSNSYTDPIQKKIRELSGESGQLDWFLDRVHGRAQKYRVDPDFDEVPESMRIDGLDRPVLLRRRSYFEVLKRLLDENERGWDSLAVVGDIFELDLALPLAMGATVALVVNEFTPDYEKAFLDAHPRGHLVGELSQIPSLLGLA